MVWIVVLTLTGMPELGQSGSDCCQMELIRDYVFSIWPIKTDMSSLCEMHLFCVVSNCIKDQITGHQIPRLYFLTGKSIISTHYPQIMRFYLSKPRHDTITSPSYLLSWEWQVSWQGDGIWSMSLCVGKTLVLLRSGFVMAHPVVVVLSL